jgi:hypothetical protein
VDTPPQERLGTGQTTNLINQDVHQFRGCVRPAVGQKPLEMIPDTFVRVEFGSVRRKRNQVQTGRAPQKLPDGIPPMSLAVIQKNDHMTPNLPQQMAKEGRDFFALDIVFIEVTVQSTMKTLPADGDPGDRRDAIVAITMTQDGRLAHGAPRLPDRRDQEEARFVSIRRWPPHCARWLDAPASGGSSPFGGGACRRDCDGISPPAGVRSGWQSVGWSTNSSGIHGPWLLGSNNERVELSVSSSTEEAGPAPAWPSAPPALRIAGRPATEGRCWHGNPCV